MKIYISADMEGVNGVVLKEHIDPAAKEYNMARGWMLAEVNAAIEGAVAAGATAVVVNDSHNTMANLPIDQLHPAAHLVCGPGKPFSMVQDMDETYAGAIFLGYHAAFGTPQAVHDHIFAYSIIEKVEINGVSVGELGLNAGLAGYHKVPTLLVTGDLAVTREAEALIPGVSTVTVKEGRGRHCAHCYPFAQTLSAIRKQTETSIRNVHHHQPLRFNTPLTLSVTFPKVEMAESAALLPGAQRTSARTLTCTPEDYPQLYRMFLALFRLAKTG